MPEKPDGAALELSVEPGQGRQRLDQAIVDAAARLGETLSRGQVARAFAAGGVVDARGHTLKASTKVRAPMQVTVQLAPPPPQRATPQAISLSVLHEDADLMVIAKPAGMPVHPGPGHPDGTVVNAVLHHFGVEADALPTLPGNDEVRPGIVHRLDKDTSGALVVARTRAAQDGLAAAFRAHDVERSYLGIVMGSPGFETRSVVSGHGRDPHERRRFAPVARGPGIRDAITHLAVERRLQGATLMRFRLETGRTHQIRMHARALGHPILGDELYGYRARTPTLQAVVTRMARQALHAGVLGFDHPVTGARVRCEAPLPPELESALRDLSPE